MPKQRECDLLAELGKKHNTIKGLRITHRNGYKVPIKLKAHSVDVLT